MKQTKREVVAGILLAFATVTAMWMTVRAVYFNGIQTYTGEIQQSQQVDLNFQNPGRLVELKVHPGDRVTAGQVVAVQDVRVAQLDIAADQAAEAADKARLTLLQSPQLQAAVAQHLSLDVQREQQNLGTAQQAASDANALAASTVAAAQQAVSAAKSLQAADQQRAQQNCPNGYFLPPGLAQTLAGSTPSPGPTSAPGSTSLQLQQYLACQHLADQISHDTAAVQQAQSALPVQQAIAQQYRDVAQRAVADASSAVSLSQNEIAVQTSPATSADISAQQAKIALDEAQIAQAQKALQDSVITAPVSGKVTQVNGNVGDLVGQQGVQSYASPQGLSEGQPSFSLFPPPPSTATVNNNQFVPLVSLDEDAGWQVMAQVPEGSIAAIHPGMGARVSIAALNAVVDAQVTQLIPVPVRVNGDVEYQVLLRPSSDPGGVLPGMSVTVSTEQSK